MRGDGRIFLRGNTFWAAYSLNGTEYRESAKTSDEKQARKFLRGRIREVGADQIGARSFTTPQASRLTVRDLIDALRAEYELRGIANAKNRSNLKRVVLDFGERRAVALSSKAIDAYIKERLDREDRPASINRTTQLLKQAYKLAVKNEHLSRVPPIRRLSEKGNERKGFVDEAQFRVILEFLPEYLEDFCLFAYVTGMRFGEVRSLKWANVKGDEIELEALDAKNGEPRIIPMVGKDLAGILARRKEAQKVKRGDSTTIAALIFHHDGKPIVDIRKAWKSACKKAGVPSLLFHDLRRAAVKHLDEAGVSRDVAMSISGHKSQSMYSRYNIVNTKRARQALEQTQLYREAAQQKIVSIAQ